MNDFLITSGGIAVVSALCIQFLKKSNWFTFLSTDVSSEKANRAFSILIAIITSLGITFSFNATQHELIIGGLDNDMILTYVIHAFSQWIGQHVAYKTVVVPTELQAAIVRTLKQINDTMAKDGK
jgi:hypothetical protein